MRIASGENRNKYDTDSSVSHRGEEIKCDAHEKLLLGIDTVVIKFVKLN
jgi:hypothetical protein